jgi:MOSC domain-containing protein YiiM
MVQPESAVLMTQSGLVGDRASEKPGRSRQVTLVQAEHLMTIAAFLRQPAVEPSQLRRNLLISGINVLSLRRARFSIGGAILEGTGHAHPCSRLEETLGHGGYNAVRGLGGITARILEGSTIELGDEVRLLQAAAEDGD